MPGQYIGKYYIDLHETYFLAYTGGTRQLSAKDYKEYQKAISIPFGECRSKELAKLPKEKNPNLVPVKGVDLISFIKELNFIPIFDKYFEQTKLLKMTDFVAYEYIKANSSNRFQTQ